jgi:hypothetical protein
LSLRSMLYLVLCAVTAESCGSASLKPSGSGGVGGTIAIRGSAGAGGTRAAGGPTDGGNGVTLVGSLISVGQALSSDGGAITVTDDGFESSGAACNDAGTICVTGAITP